MRIVMELTNGDRVSCGTMDSGDWATHYEKIVIDWRMSAAFCFINADDLKPVENGRIVSMEIRG